MIPASVMPHKETGIQKDWQKREGGAMVVKVMEGSCWHCFDGVRHVRHVRTMEKPGEGCDKSFSLVLVEEGSNRQTVEIDLYREYNSGVVFSILTDSIVYLMSDEGKTIERLN